MIFSFQLHNEASSAHYNAANFLIQLEDQSPRNIQLLVSCTYAGLAVLYSLAMVLGVWLFGSRHQGTASSLTCFADGDPLAKALRWLYVANILTIFPMVLSAATSRLYDVINIEGKKKRVNFASVSLGLAAFACTLGILVDNAGTLVNLNGAIAVNFFVWIVPSLLSLQVSLGLARTGNLAMMGMGFALMAIGLSNI